jgi:hypothetical protein
MDADGPKLIDDETRTQDFILIGSQPTRRSGLAAPLSNIHVLQSNGVSRTRNSSSLSWDTCNKLLSPLINYLSE